MDETEYEVVTLVGGMNLAAHPKTKCDGELCPIHNPSNHHMREWTQWWRGDRKLMERVCPHGVGHPDPDDPQSKGYGAVHGCDGCCVPPEDSE